MAHGNMIATERAFVAEFIKMKCRGDNDARVSARELFACYRRYRPAALCGQRAFGMILRDLGYASIKASVIYWCGLRLL